LVTVMGERVRISIPLSSMIGNVRRVLVTSPFPREKKQLEQYVVSEFARLPETAPMGLSDIRSSGDDASGKPDVLAQCGAQTVGFQLTELKIEHRPRSAHAANTMSHRLADAVLRQGKPARPVVVTINSHHDYLNKLLKLSSREIDWLAHAIIKGCLSQEFIDIDLKGPPPSRYLSVVVPEALRNKLSYITISPIPDASWTGARGGDGVFVNVGFERVSVSPSELKKLVERLGRKKRHSKAEILLIWCRDQDFYGMEDNLADLLRNEFADSAPERVYFLAFRYATRADPNRFKGSSSAWCESTEPTERRPRNPARTGA